MAAFFHLRQLPTNENQRVCGFRVAIQPDRARVAGSDRNSAPGSAHKAVTESIKTAAVRTARLLS